MTKMVRMIRVVLCLRVADLWSPRVLIHLSGHVGSVFRREENEAGCYLIGLPHAPHRHLRTVLSRLILVKRGWDKWGPDWAGRYRVDANLLFDEGLGQRARETDNGALSGRIVDQFHVALVGRDGGRVDNRGSIGRCPIR